MAIEACGILTVGKDGWEPRLRGWGFPEQNLYNFATALDEAGLLACDFPTPQSLYKTLRVVVDREVRQMRMVGLVACDDMPFPLNYLCLGLAWLWEEYIAPYTGDIGMILLGGIAIMVLPRYYKLIGAIPIVYGIYDAMRKLMGG